MPVVLLDHHRRCILLVALAYLCVLLHGPSYAVSAESLFIDKVTYYESGVSEAVEPGPMPTIWNWTASRSRHLAPGGAGFRTIFTPYAELYHYEFTSRGREEANEEKLRRWKREQALFMQRWPELFLMGDPWLGANLSANSEYFSHLGNGF